MFVPRTRKKWVERKEKNLGIDVPEGVSRRIV